MHLLVSISHLRFGSNVRGNLTSTDMAEVVVVVRVGVMVVVVGVGEWWWW